MTKDIVKKGWESETFRKDGGETYADMGRTCDGSVGSSPKSCIKPYCVV